MRSIIGRETFQEQLLVGMEGKAHWSESAFRGLVPKQNMRHHFQGDYTVFVRPFPEYLRGALLQGPVPDKVRSDLEANIDEEENGTFAGAPHPELFLDIPQAFGFDTDKMRRFTDTELAPAAKRYKDFLMHATHERGWEPSVALSTIFLEGNKHERAVFDPNAPQRPSPPAEQHPLVLGYGISPDALTLYRAHQKLDSADGEHRLAAWRMVLDHIAPEKRIDVLRTMKEAQGLWLDWRDEVAAACGIRKGENGQPALAGSAAR